MIAQGLENGAPGHYRVTRRGGQGVITVRTSHRNGAVVTIKAVTDSDELMIMSSGGVIPGSSTAKIFSGGRATQGVKLMDLEGDDVVVDAADMVVEENVRSANSRARNGNRPTASVIKKKRKVAAERTPEAERRPRP